MMMMMSIVYDLTTLFFFCLKKSEKRPFPIDLSWGFSSLSLKLGEWHSFFSIYLDIGYWTRDREEKCKEYKTEKKKTEPHLNSWIQAVFYTGWISAYIRWWSLYKHPCSLSNAQVLRRTNTIVFSKATTIKYIGVIMKGHDNFHLTWKMLILAKNFSRINTLYTNFKNKSLKTLE